MLDRNPALAVPDESYFVPQLARRHRGAVEPAAFLDDLRRLPTLVEWGLSPEVVAPHLRPGMATGAAIAAVFEAYAAERGKPRWGDKTPLYMQHLPLLERLFPDALFVHLVRDGRDAALSFLSLPTGIMTRGGDTRVTPPASPASGRPRCAPPGRSGRVSALPVPRDPRGPSSPTLPPSCGACATSRLVFDEDMLAYVGRTDSARKEHQQRLGEAPRTGVRDWRTEMTPRIARRSSTSQATSSTSSVTRSPALVTTARSSPSTARRPRPGAPSARYAALAAWRRRHAILQKPGV